MTNITKEAILLKEVKLHKFNVLLQPALGIAASSLYGSAAEIQLQLIARPYETLA